MYLPSKYRNKAWLFENKPTPTRLIEYLFIVKGLATIKKQQAVIAKYNNKPSLTCIK